MNWRRNILRVAIGSMMLMLCEGTVATAQETLTGTSASPPPPRPLPKAAIHKAPKADGRPVAALVFYRALVQSGDLALVEAIVEALDAEGLDALAIYVAGLKDPEAGS